jgi:hypothetical protein
LLGDMARLGVNASGRARARADRGEALLDGQRGSLATELLDVGRDMQRLHVGDRRDAGALAAGQKFVRRLRIGAPRVLVTDVRGEEFEEAVGSARAGGGDKGRGAISEWDELVHAATAT